MMQLYLTGVGDLLCETDAHCTSHISNSYCSGSVCMCDYGYYAKSHAVSYAHAYVITILHR